MSRYAIVATVNGVWVQYLAQEFESSEVAKDLVGVIGKLLASIDGFRCFVILTRSLPDIIGKDAKQAHGVIVYGPYNTFII